MSHQGKSRQSVLTYQNPNKQLIKLLLGKGIFEPKKITEEHLKDYQIYLFEERDFAPSSVATFMKHVRLFFEYLIGKGELQTNIARDIKVLPKPELPKEQLSHFYTYDEIMRRYLGNQKRWISFSYMNMVKKHLRGFIKYLKSNEVKSVYAVTESALLKYRDFLWDDYVHYRKDSLVARSQIERLRCVVRLFRYLCKEGILNDNPARKLDWEHYYKGIIEKAKTLPQKPAERNNLTEFGKLKLKFIEYEAAKGKSRKTIKQYRKAVEVFFEYLDEKGVSNLAQVSKRLISDYFIHLCNYVGVRGEPASNAYKNHLLWGMRLFFRFLVRSDELAKDPTVDLESIKEDRGLPTAYMNEKEVFELIGTPRLNHDPLPYRDKAILEVFFSTAIRCNELASLNLDDIDYQHEMLRVNNPKGGAGYQRIVPIDGATLETVKLYLAKSRPVIENGEPKALFLSYRGQRLHNDSILNIVKKYVFQCGFRKNITTHSLRVTCATLLHKNGADIRYIQEQLGHKRITSTQIYTRLMPLDLKAVHRRCHPREKSREKNGEKKQL